MNQTIPNNAHSLLSNTRDHAVIIISEQCGSFRLSLSLSISLAGAKGPEPQNGWLKMRIYPKIFQSLLLILYSEYIYMSMQIVSVPYEVKSWDQVKFSTLRFANLIILHFSQQRFPRFSAQPCTMPSYTTLSVAIWRYEDSYFANFVITYWGTILLTQRVGQLKKDIA